MWPQPPGGNQAWHQSHAQLRGPKDQDGGAPAGGAPHVHRLAESSAAATAGVDGATAAANAAAAAYSAHYGPGPVDPRARQLRPGPPHGGVSYPAADAYCALNQPAAAAPPLPQQQQQQQQTAAQPYLQHQKYIYHPQYHQQQPGYAPGPTYHSPQSPMQLQAQAAQYPHLSPHLSAVPPTFQAANSVGAAYGSPLPVASPPNGYTYGTHPSVPGRAPAGWVPQAMLPGAGPQALAPMAQQQPPAAPPPPPPAGGYAAREPGAHLQPAARDARPGSSGGRAAAASDGAVGARAAGGGRNRRWKPPGGGQAGEWEAFWGARGGNG
jgi:hypothetical protein